VRVDQAHAATTKSREYVMKTEPTNTDGAHYQLFRSKQVVFVVKHDEGDCFIALSADTTDEKALQMASEAPNCDWRKIDTIIFRDV